MEQHLKSICFFLATGRTYTFSDVVILSDNETAITVGYKATSDGLNKNATFYKSHVVGVAKCSYEAVISDKTATETAAGHYGRTINN